MASTASHREMAAAIRILAADAVERAKSGHPGLPIGFADVATVLYTRFLKFDPTAPRWVDRDRVVLSAGHGSMLLYALNYLTGYAAFTLDQLRNFRQLDSRTPGHPEHDPDAGIETSTGPLGQGFGNAVGMALAEAMLAARFGRELVDHYTYVIAGDGDLMEGISHEAASLAGHLRLNRLIVLWDDNRISIDGATALTVSDDVAGRFQAYGWLTLAADGHDPAAIAAAIDSARRSDRPVLIACRTVIAYGAPTKAGSEKAHGAPLGGEEIAGLRRALDWTSPPFEIPAPILAAWRAAGENGQPARAAWQARLDAALPALRSRFEDMLNGKLPESWLEAVAGYLREVLDKRPSVATRKASQDVLERLSAAIPSLVGGSADLTGSNLTKTKATVPVAAGRFEGRYLYYGVREFAMAAAMNGLALHGGFIPYGGTFLVFSDYLRSGIRLSALMRQRVIYVLTHDSIGVGEDGPTHQPIEHLAMLRATPNVLVLRPADAVETAECWAIALQNADGPSVLALSRQNLPILRSAAAENLSERGAYLLSDAVGDRQATLIATGSEVALALKAQALLQTDSIGTAVVSMPSWELFERQSPAYRAAVLGPADGVRVAIEAGGAFGWERYVGTTGAVIAMRGFGKSAPGDTLFAHFGFTPEAVAAEVRARLTDDRSDT